MANNLFSNLLVVGILFAVFTIIYCKIKNITIGEMFTEIKELIFGTNE